LGGNQSKVAELLMIVGGMKEDDAIISISGEINSAKNGSMANDKNLELIDQKGYKYEYC
jgi:hypothetical protein